MRDVMDSTRPPKSPTPGPALLLARGARAAEALLLREVRAQVEAARADPRLLAQPVRIVVPSRSLREHVAGAIVRELGTVAGVTVQTLHGFACEIVQRAGVRQAHGDDLYPLLVRAEAAAEPRLRGLLAGLEDGYGAVVGAVSDFLDAGLVDAEAVVEALAPAEADGARAEEIDRACAIARVAERVQRVLEREDLGHRSRRLAAAHAALRDPAVGVPIAARAVLFHGFADATALALDLLQAARDRLGAIVLLDRPPDLAEAATGTPPGGVAEEDGIVRFTADLAEAIAGNARVVPADGRSRPDRLHLVSAPAPAAETRAAAAQVRRWIDEEGIAPERIGIVARRLDPYALPLRIHLRRLGVPFSSPASGPAGPALRRARAFLDVIARGGEAPVDAFLEAAQMPLGLRADLRVACHALAAGRLAELAALRVEDVLEEDGSYPLPVRRGLGRIAADGEAEESGVVVATRRRVSGAHLHTLVESARAATGALAAEGVRDSAREQLARLRRALAALDVASAPSRSPRSTAPALRLPPLLDALDHSLPAAAELTREELVLLLAPRIDASLREPFGGAGAGVRVLDATAARGCTFERLVVLGLSRGLFPRVVRGDPLLPDSLRRALRRQGVLERFPVKERGYDEERWLVAELLSAAQIVVLSWPRSDDDGRERAPSPFVEEIRLALGSDTTEEAPGLHALDVSREGTRPIGPRTAHEHAILAGVHEDEEAFARALPEALAEARAIEPAALATSPPELAAARLAALRELDRAPGPDTPLGPYFGFVGRSGTCAADPRANDPAVTTLERVAGCAWQGFLERMLRLEPVPDALGALPSLDVLVVGNVVHRALEEVARRAGAPGRVTLDAAARTEGVVLRWPDEATLDRILHEAASAVLREAHLAAGGLAPALVELARPSLRLARAADEGAAPPRVLAIEVDGACEVEDAAGHRRRISFRADRVERVGEALVLTDFKTGKPLSHAKKEDTRRAHHLDAVRSGAKLQAAAYARSVVTPAGRAVGHYVHLGADLAQVAVFSTAEDAAEFDAAFGDVARTLLRVIDAGSFVPRLEGPNGREPRACGRCAVSEACLRGDSGSRRRLVEWADRQARASRPADDAEAAAVALWELGEGKR
jgi:hypothetical protein